MLDSASVVNQASCNSMILLLKVNRILLFTKFLWHGEIVAPNLRRCLDPFLGNERALQLVYLNESELVMHFLFYFYCMIVCMTFPLLFTSYIICRGIA